MIKYLLVIDTMKERHDVFEKELAEFGNSVRLLTASTGREGLQIVRKVKPAMTLINFRLDDMDGLTCIKRIRALKRMPELPVLVYDNNPNFHLVKNAQVAGATAIFNVSETAKALKYFLQMLYGAPDIQKKAEHALQYK